jgi:hypothetical protein
LVYSGSPDVFTSPTDPSSSSPFAGAFSGACKRRETIRRAAIAVRQPTHDYQRGMDVDAACHDEWVNCVVLAPEEAQVVIRRVFQTGPAIKA